MDEHKDPQFAEAEVWATLDGCEPGDLLRGLVDEASRARDGHGYAMSNKTEKYLRLAIDAEIEAHEEWIKGEGADYQEPAYVEECLNKIEELRKKRIPDNPYTPELKLVNE